MTIPSPNNAHADLVADLRERARCLEIEASYRMDGGQELTMEAIELEKQADQLERDLESALQEGDDR